MLITDNTPLEPATIDDLSQFLVECDRYVEGLVQQSLHARQGTALGGHPNPGFFYGRSAQLMKAMIDLIRKENGIEPTKPTPFSPATDVLNMVTTNAAQRTPDKSDKSKKTATESK